MTTSPVLEVAIRRQRPERRRQQLIRRTRRTFSILLLAAVWELYAHITANRLAPSFNEILRRLWEQASSGDLWFHGQLTLQRGLIGLALACLVGIPLGISLGRNRWLDAMFEPLLGGTYPVPKLALYPVFVLIFGLGAASKVWLVALECVYPIALNSYAGARRIDKDLMWLARNAGAGRWRTLRDVVLPSCLAPIMTGLRISASIMLIIMVVSEMIGESRGLGYMLTDAQARFRPDNALAVVVVLGLLGFVLDRIVVFCTQRLVYWERAHVI